VIKNLEFVNVNVKVLHLQMMRSWVIRNLFSTIIALCSLQWNLIHFLISIWKFKIRFAWPAIYDFENQFILKT